MALVAHQIQSRHSPLSLQHKSGSRSPQKLVLLPVKLQFLPRARGFDLAKRRPFMVLSFKGISQNDESECRDGSSRFSKNPVQLSHMKEDQQEIIAKPFDAQNHLSYSFQDSKERSLAIKELFKKWLIVLRTQKQSQKIDKLSGKGPIQTAVPESMQVKVKTGTLKFLQSACTLFLGLDASISLPLAIFIPWFLTIRLLYGAEVTKELTPLWVFGPLIASLYIKIVKGLCSFYAFCFIEVVKLVKNLPHYCQLAYNYIYEGKIKSLLLTKLIKPFVDIKNMGAKEALRRQFKRLEERFLEQYLDFIESIWPYYWRTLMFLKKTNFI
ncbi:hypothetical protein HPP92_001300 [Vanilla planifolia]|uniref:Embryo defective 2759 n=1 Tax=Vanilla planifolia TaxID=51239 RepID=A0A835RRG2_VANPL|nr:hypothetical protein HPP92_001300 [Vanilla planifolia]